LSKDLILLDGLGIAHSELVPTGTVAIILRDGEVHVVPADILRETVRQIGSDNVEGLTMSPSDFEKLKAVVERQAAESSPESTVKDPE
jgi:hypothetical protein